MAGRSPYLHWLQPVSLVAAGVVAGALLLPPLQEAAGRTVLTHTAREIFILFIAGPLAAYPLKNRVRRLASPLLGLLLSNVLLLSWQMPWAVSMTASNPLLDDAGVLIFQAAATIFWLPLFRSQGPLSQIGRVGYLLVAGVPPTLPGVVLGFSRRVYYTSSIHGPGIFNLSPLTDQHLAGLLLFGTAKLVLVTGVFVLVWKLLSGEREPPDDRRGFEESPALPPSAPSWYRRLDDELAPEPAPLSLRPGAMGRPSGTAGSDRRPAQLPAGPVAARPEVQPR
jgi:cytochrome c oxidase assembly factor CtaG